MTDKEKQYLIAEIERLKDCASPIVICDTLLSFIDSMQEEPVSNDFEMALAEMIDKAQKCVVEPLVVAEQWKDELIKLAKSEEPVSDEQVKELAESQHEDETCKNSGNSLTEEPVSESIDFEQELYKAFGQIKDFTLGVAIAKRFYDMGRKHNEPVSEGSETAATLYAANEYNKKNPSSLPQRCIGCYAPLMYAFKDGAKWQIAKLMKDAIEVTVHIDAGGYPYIPQIELYDYDKDIPLAKEGDKYKVVLINSK